MKKKSLFTLFNRQTLANKLSVGMFCIYKSYSHVFRALLTFQKHSTLFQNTNTILTNNQIALFFLVVCLVQLSFFFLPLSLFPFLSLSTFFPPYLPVSQPNLLMLFSDFPFHLALCFSVSHLPIYLSLFPCFPVSLFPCFSIYIFISPCFSVSPPISLAHPVSLLPHLPLYIALFPCFPTYLCLYSPVSLFLNLTTVFLIPYLPVSLPLYLFLQPLFPVFSPSLDADHTEESNQFLTGLTQPEYRQSGQGFPTPFLLFFRPFLLFLFLIPFHLLPDVKLISC